MDNLEDPAHLQDFVAALGKELSSTPVPPSTTTTEELWQSFKDQVVKITMEVLGFTLRKDQDQFDDNDPKISRLIDENQWVKNMAESDPSSIVKQQYFIALKTLVQKKIWQIKSEWWIAKAAETQAFMDRCDMRNF